jgi:hypothetical protein
MSKNDLHLSTGDRLHHARDTLNTIERPPADLDRARLIVADNVNCDPWIDEPEKPLVVRELLEILGLMS